MEYTRAGVRDGSFLPGVDLWDEVNGDSAVSTSASADHCRAACVAANATAAAESDITASSSTAASVHGRNSSRSSRADHDGNKRCGAWTFNSVSKTCRFKEYAQHSLLVTTTAACFTPNYAGSNATVSTSGFVQQQRVRFAALYIERSHSWITNTSCGWGGDCGYGHFNFAAMLRIYPGESALNVHAFADKSIVEVFGQGGRAAVTARVYPTLPSSDRIGTYNAGSSGAVLLHNAEAWELASASTN